MPSGISASRVASRSSSMPSTVVVQCVWRHVARHRVHRGARTHREDPHPSRRGWDRVDQPSPRTAAACARSRTPGHPITERILTASTGAQRRAAPHLPHPGPQPAWQALIVAGSTKSHRLDREMAALGPPTNLSATTSILPQQRRSAVCPAYPSPEGCGRFLHRLLREDGGVGRLGREFP